MKERGRRSGGSDVRPETIALALMVVAMLALGAGKFWRINWLAGTGALVLSLYLLLVVAAITFGVVLAIWRRIRKS
jgi:hypothetical protein